MKRSRPASERPEAVMTPDGRYLVIAGRLWRATNPALSDDLRQQLVMSLMDARRAVKAAKRGEGDLAEARRAVDAAKTALGERGPVWWTDGTPDQNRKLVENTPYAGWAATLGLTRKAERASDA